ncbi:MAG: DUF2341 domain-containing protein [Gammaproteobacteria bacterium]
MKNRVFVAVCVMLGATAAKAWWNNDWSQRQQLILNTTPAGVALQSPVADVPVLVRLHAGNFPHFLNVRDGGVDFRFVDGDDLTPLAYHVERFDAISQIALVWVKLSSVRPNASDQKLHLYFGNPAAVRGEDAGATFDADTVAAFHFDEAAGMPADSTAYGTAFTSGEWFSNPASIIGNGAMLGATQALTMADAPQLAIDPARGWSASLWVRFDELPAAPAFLLDRRGTGEPVSLYVEDGQLKASYGATAVTSFSPLAAGQWHHVGLVLAADGMQLYLDGAQVGGAPIALAAGDGAITIGGDADGAGLAAVAIDELRLASAARSADHMAFAAAIQGERNDAVVTYLQAEAAGAEGEAANEGGGHAGHFGIIIQNVFGRSEAIVEQLVIGLCGVMAAVAIMVMFLKAIYLSRCKRSTRRFIEAFESPEASGEGMESLYEREDDFGDSPLFAVYRAGIEQVRARLSPSVGASAAGLDQKALGSIQASLDATMVRQNQQLNGLLVLLTIAISGGPFIGLLGTVVGVMVTFAAIAATGDVNIAAIAPGMAAALLATVAGLGVAIPALFGYNYLSAMAKDVNADMQVFADELMAKVNERYGL